jgi:hypothetical protein
LAGLLWVAVVWVLLIYRQGDDIEIKNKRHCQTLDCFLNKESSVRDNQRAPRNLVNSAPTAGILELK